MIMYKQQKPLTLSSGLLACAVTALVLLVAASANAQTGGGTNPVSMPERREAISPPSGVRPAAGMSVSGVSSDRQAERRANLAERQAALEQKRLELADAAATRQAALGQAAQVRVRQMTGASVSLLSESIGKTRSLHDRLHRHAEDLGTRGIDMSAALAALDQANELLRDAETALSGIDISIEYALTSSDPRADWSDARVQLQSVREILQEARLLMREALAAIKTSVRPPVSGS